MEVTEPVEAMCASPSLTTGAKDLLRISVLSRLVRHSFFLLSVQIPNMLVFALVIASGLYGVQNGGRNFATIVTWVIWWPLVIFTFILVGRFWCLGCPLGAVGEWTHRGVLWGRGKTNWSLDRKWPARLRNLWLPTAFLLAVTWADYKYSIVGSPLHTAYFVILIITAAVVIGLIFERRAFCRYVCPIGGMIGLYSMLAPVGVRARETAVCKGHKEKDCFRGNGAGYGCPMFELPQTMDRNNYCNYCMECAKTCPKDNIAIKLKAFFTDLVETRVRRLDEAILVMVLVGLTAFQSLVMTRPWEGWVDRVSNLLGLGHSEAFILMYGFISLITPLALFGAAVLAARLLSGEKRMQPKNLFVVLGYMFIPVGLAMHLAHNVSHLVNEGSGVLAVISDPFGYGWDLFGSAAYRAAPLLPASALNLVQVALIVIGQGVAAYAGYRLARSMYSEEKQAQGVVISMLTLAAAFTLLNVWILGLPMSHRH